MTASDASGNASQAATFFTIDLVPPKVTNLASRRNWLRTPFASFSSLFTDSDDDGASGGVVHEVVSLDGCIVYDGLTYGNNDGLLRDETLPGPREGSCRLIQQCGKQQWNDPELAVTATDRGGNSVTATSVIHGVHRLPAKACDRGTQPLPKTPL